MSNPKSSPLQAISHKQLMPNPKRSKTSAASGYQPQETDAGRAEKWLTKSGGYRPQETDAGRAEKPQETDAGRAEKDRKLTLAAAVHECFIHPNQPDRVKLEQISWHKRLCSPTTLQYHAQDIAAAIVTQGTSNPRFQHVKLVEMPEHRVKYWLAENKMLADLAGIPKMADFEAMSHTGPYYASLGGTGFVEARASS